MDVTISVTFNCLCLPVALVELPLWQRQHLACLQKEVTSSDASTALHHRSGINPSIVIASHIAGRPTECHVTNRPWSDIVGVFQPHKSTSSIRLLGNAVILYLLSMLL